MDIESLSTHTLDAMIDLVLDLWPDCTRDEELENYARLLDSANDGCYLANSGDEYVAFVHVSCRHDYVEGATELPVAYIEGIYVKPAYRKRGVAIKLIQAAENWARQKGLTQIASDTEITNGTSIDFHQRAGFEEVERIVCFIKNLR